MSKPSPRHRRLSPFERVPLGVREQPAWIFIGVMFVVIGLGYATGGAHSMLTEAIGTLGLRLWGASITATGVFLMVATAKAKPSLEKFALRVLSSNLFAYAAWLLTVVPFARAGTTVILTASLIVLAEFRVLHLRQLMKRTSIIRYELNERDR